MPTLSFSCTSTPLSSADVAASLAAMNLDPVSLWTILTVESGKAGYLPDRRPQILFESHQFHNKTGGIYDASNPGISQPTWVRDYAGGAGEYARLAQAYALNADAALQSASWGLGQIMGFNFSNAGYNSASDMVQDACASEAMQLKQFQNFLTNTGVLAPLQAQDWSTVARNYNGPGQVPVYSQKLQTAYTQLQNPSQLPDIDVRAAQLYLRFLSASNNSPTWNPSAIDGLWGPRTQAALNAFQTAQGIAITTGVDNDVLTSLAAALPAPIDLELS